MKKLYILCLVLCTQTLWAQSPGDTITVHTFDYSMTYGSGDRDTIVNFPNDPNLKFEKIFMLYSMRCKDGQVSTGANRNKGCGEWDYSCNTYIEDDSRADSVKATTPSHKIANYSGSTLPYVSNPLIDYYRKIYTQTNLQNVTSESNYPIGTPNTNINHSFPLQHYTAKNQYVYTASELTTAGLTAGDIHGFFFFPVNTITADFCTVKIKSTTANQLTPEMGGDTSGFTQVFFDKLAAYAFPTGHRLLFHSPYYWDGTSDLIIEISYTNLTGNGGFTLPEIKGTPALQQGLSTSGNQHPLFQAQNYLEISGYKGIGGSDPRTVEAWIKTSVTNNEIVSWGLNQNSKKWIVRVNGSGELRAEVAGGYIIGTTDIADDQWHHVAVVLDGSDVTDIQLYVDGTLESISSSQNIAINTENTTSGNVTIAHGHNNTYFDGNIDNIRIWSAALSPATIAGYKNAAITSQHPDYSSLELDLSKDSTSATLWEDLSTHGRDAQIVGGLWMERDYGEFLQDNFSVVDQKPALVFFRGVYTTTTTYDTVNLTTYPPPNTVSAYTINSNTGTTLSDEVVLDTLLTVWDASQGYRYYDENNVLINTSPVTATDTIEITDLEYWQRNPMRFEIMSFVTPYGINLDLGPEGKTWIFDLTDFAPLFKGDRRLIMNKGGQWQEDMDIKFQFVVGTPTREAIDITNIWKSDRSTRYQDLLSQKYFAPRTLDPTQGASQYKLRTSITGHGQEGEFIPRMHSILADNTTAKNWQVYKGCGFNPIYPQGGTWIYDRTGWCPGMATDLEETDLSSYFAQGAVELDYELSTATGDSRYIISHQLVSYQNPNFMHDAELIDVLSPSNKIDHLRSNPSCQEPQVVIRNTGTEPLTSATIKFGVESNPQKGSYQWSGNLDFLETDTVALPADQYDIWSDIAKDTNNLFSAEITDINGGDQSSHNNFIKSYFDVPIVFPSGIVFYARANNAPSETTYEVLDKSGAVIYSKKIDTAGKLIRDTVMLSKGCYTIRLTDTDEDGISWWANNDGNGSCLIYSATGGLLHRVQGDFGGEYSIDFTVDWPLDYERVQELYDVSIYPVPAHEQLVIEALDIDEATLKIYDMLGREVWAPMSRDPDLVQYQLDKIPSGVYVLDIILRDHHITKQITVQH